VSCQTPIGISSRVCRTFASTSEPYRLGSCLVYLMQLQSNPLSPQFVVRGRSCTNQWLLRIQNSLVPQELSSHYSLITYHKVAERTKAEDPKLMTEVPELRQRIADKSLPLEKLAKHGNARRREGDFYFLPWSSCTAFTQSRAHHNR
jgi:hypothetical protein